MKTLCNVFSAYKGSKLIICVVEKDNETQEKKTIIIENPEIDFYVSKPEFKDKHKLERPLFPKIAEVDKITCKYSQLFPTMMEAIKRLDVDAKGEPTKQAVQYITLFKTSVINNDAYGLKKMHSHPMIFNSDMEIEDIYIQKWKRENPESINTGELSKAYFDIESDVINLLGFPDEFEAPCKTSAISYFFNNKLWAMLSLDIELRNNDHIKDFMTRTSEFSDKLRSKYNIPSNIEIKFEFFNLEIDMIKFFFNLVNEVDKPDVCMAWNLSYDFNTLKNRIDKLGYFSSNIMSSKKFNDINACQSYYYVDKRAKDISGKGDYSKVSSGTQFIDQMLVFAKIRVTMGKRESYALDAILYEELKANKVDLEDTDIKHVMYDDYDKFVEYSLIDTYRLHQLEEKNKDMDLIYSLMMMTSTRYNKVLTKTTSLKNLIAEFEFNRGIILANNPNQNHLVSSNKTEEKESFKAAFVANPNLIDPQMGVTMKNGLNNPYIFDFVIDFDLASLYPHILLSNNISTETMYFKIEDPEVLNYMEIMTAKDLLQVGNKYFDLPPISEWMDII